MACQLCPSLHHLRIHHYSLGSRGKSINGTIFFRSGVRLKSVVRAQLSNFFSSPIGLDTQDLSPLSWIGPVPGDIAEVEAYCRIFRSVEKFHNVTMHTLCNPMTGECTVSYDIPPEFMASVEEKMVTSLGRMVALLNRGREDVLGGRSFINSFQVADRNDWNGELPPLAIFRGEMKNCCENLHIAIEKYLAPFDDGLIDVWRNLQRLKNVCYDSGFPRGEDYPDHALFANWAPVYLSLTKDEASIKNSEIEADFWRGGQVTDEGLKWLIDKGYKTIVDIREETVNDEYYRVALEEAVSSGKIEVVKLPVKIGTVPSAEQVKFFSSLVLDSSKRPLYLHSQEGIHRTSSMISRWKQYMSHHSAQSIVDPNLNLNGHLKGLEPQIQIQTKTENTNGISEINFIETESESPQYSNNSTPLKDEGTNADNEKSVVYEINPFKAQFPKGDVFSKKEMSKFFKTKRITPPIKQRLIKKRYVMFPFSGELDTHTSSSKDFDSHGLIKQLGNTDSDASMTLNTNGMKPMKSGSTFSKININGYPEKKGHVMENPATSTVIDGFKGKNMSSIEVKTSNPPVSVPSSESDSVTLEGNICSSTTGVVRVQSRKKAEMFLVRTDGFSCTREKVTETSLAFSHPSTQQQMLMWKSTPKTVLLLKKLGKELMKEAKEVASFLYYEEHMNVIVEPDLHDIFARMPGFGFVQTFYSQDTSDLHESVDFVVCLGGDGVILHASNLFRGAVPPVVSFNLGSLGFLTSHSFEEYKRDLGAVIHGNNTLDGVYITLRMRLRCEIFRDGKPVPGKVFDVLNEVVVDRGSNPYLSKIECYEHNHLITKVQGDGVIIATPTGSTAYSTAAGGSMVHPNVPCILFTPICPHSLSFRPVVLPDSAQLILKIPEDTRSNAWVSFDGKRRQQLSRGDSISICMSQHPLPTVNKSDQTGDWFHSLIRCLNWNERLDQKAL